MYLTLQNNQAILPVLAQNIRVHILQLGLVLPNLHS